MDDRALTHPRRQLSSLSPDNDRQVAGLIARLLLHFWAPSDLSEAARKAMAADWLDDLREFDAEIISEACGRWRRTETRRPTPAAIRAFAIEARADRAPIDQGHMLTGPGSEEAYARSAGFPSHLARMDAIQAQNRRYEHAEQWRRQTGYSPTVPGAKRIGEFAPSADQLALSRAELGLEARETINEEPRGP